MPLIAQRLSKHIQRRMFTERASEKPWGHAIGLTVVTAVAYFLVARTGLALLKPEGVAVIWPALGLAVGGLIALGSDARVPVATGICVGIIAARLRAGGSFWLAIALGLCNTGGALLTARLIERWFGPAFKLENVSCVLGFLGATAVGTLAAAVSGTAAVAIAEPTTDILNFWRGWFTSAALGIVTVAPLPIGLASAMRRAPPRREQIEGATALVTLGAASAFVISLPPGPWTTAVPVAVVFPMVLWIAVRCRPVFAAAAAFIVALIVAGSTTLVLGDFGNASVPLPDRTLAAQTIVLAGALCLLILSALFAERRQYEMILEDSNRRLQLVLAQREEAERTLSDRNTQLALAGKVALVGSYAYDVNADEMRVSEGYAAIHGLPEGTAETTRSAWRTRVHPEDVGRVERLRSRALRDRACEQNLEYRIVSPDRGVRWIEARSFISYNGDGSAHRVIGANIDVTERRRTEQALTDRNRQLELAGKAALVGRFAIDIDVAREKFGSQRMQFSPGFAAIYGLPEETVEISVGGWHSLVHPDDLRQFLEHRQQLFAERRGEHHAEFRIVRPCGTIRWIEARSFIEYDQAGHTKRLVGVNIDITERKRAEEARKILNAELDHRVKNALATVTAVISHTQQESRSVADFAAALEGRIRSMAATHELLSSRHWQELSLIELIRCELAPYVASKNTEISGPTVLLKPEVGQALAMVLHELTTNAAKHGALSTNKGRVLIRWDRRLSGRPLSNLVLEWREVGGPRVYAPGKSSYGTSTIQDLIPYEFGGTVDLVFAPEGVRCRLELPPGWLTNAGEPTKVVADTTR
jgi:PAS domain S-box-containing protein